MAYSLAAWVASHQSFLDLIKAETGPPTVKVKSAADATLAEVVINEATAAVNGSTAVLTLPILTQEDASVGGTASYAQICDGAGAPHLEVPCLQGLSAVPGSLVINTLALIEGQAFEVLSLVINPGDIL